MVALSDPQAKEIRKMMSTCANKVRKTIMNQLRYSVEDNALHNLNTINILDNRAKAGNLRVVSWNCRQIQYTSEAKNKCMKTKWIARTINPEVMLLQETFANVVDEDYIYFGGLKRFFNKFSKEQKAKLLKNAPETQ